MTKNETIRKRKSIRKYKPEKLDQETLSRVQAQIKKLKPLYPTIETHVAVVDKVKRTFGIVAPHYLVIYSEDKEGAYENVGFMGQQMDLFFSENGLGSCWLGVAKAGKEAEEEIENKGNLIYIICIAFGWPALPLHRSVGEFRRKSLASVGMGEDPRLEAARLAPSGVNAQGWFFIAKEGRIHCYRKDFKGLTRWIRIYSQLSLIDVGIAICHIAVESEDFKFEQVQNPPQKEGFVYVGTVV